MLLFLLLHSNKHQTTQGIYFTTSLAYSSKYIKEFDKTVFFVGFLASGSVFPVVENPRAPKSEAIQEAILSDDVAEVEALLHDDTPVDPKLIPQLEKMLGEAKLTALMAPPRRPSVHSLEGQAQVNGYDTHFTLVHQIGSTPNWVPWCPGDKPLEPGTIEHTELVTFGQETVVPAFILHLKKKL